MIVQKALKINGRVVRDYRESISLFNIFEAGKHYALKLSPVRKFFFEEVKESKERLCKVIGKKLLGKNKLQLNLHDGTNVIGDNKIKVGDSLYLDFSGKIKKHVPLEKGGEVFIVSGRYAGQSGKIINVVDKKATIKLKDKSTILGISGVFAL
jgi:ribosomal protein S4E